MKRKYPKTKYYLKSCHPLLRNLFVKFLIDNRAIDDFEVSLSHGKQYCVDTYDLLINRAFGWITTKQGDRYWFRLHRKWAAIKKPQYNLSKDIW